MYIVDWNLPPHSHIPVSALLDLCVCVHSFISAYLFHVCVCVCVCVCVVKHVTFSLSPVFLDIARHAQIAFVLISLYVVGHSQAGAGCFFLVSCMLLDIAKQMQIVFVLVSCMLLDMAKQVQIVFS